MIYKQTTNYLAFYLMVYKQVTDSLAFYCNVRLIFDDLQTNTKLFGFLWQCILRFIKKNKNKGNNRERKQYIEEKNQVRGVVQYTVYYVKYLIFQHRQ